MPEAKMKEVADAADMVVMGMPIHSSETIFES